MTRQKIMIAGIVAARRYRQHPPGGCPARWVQQRPRSEAKAFDLLGGVSKIVGGALKGLGDTVAAILGGGGKPASSVEKAEPAKRPYKHSHKRTGWRRGLPGRL